MSRLLYVDPAVGERAHAAGAEDVHGRLYPLQLAEPAAYGLREPELRRPRRPEPDGGYGLLSHGVLLCGVSSQTKELIVYVWVGPVREPIRAA